MVYVSECLLISQIGAKYNPKQFTDRQMDLGTQKVTLNNLGLKWKILCHSRFVNKVSSLAGFVTHCHTGTQDS